jgi:hypothetical protein
MAATGRPERQRHSTSCSCMTLQRYSKMRPLTGLASAA